MRFQTQYNYNRGEEFDSPKYGTVQTGESMTQQSDAEDADINVIMKRYGQGAMLPQVLQQPIYGDFTGITDYRQAVDMVRAADEAFAEVPAKIREEFKNDPAEFIKFAQNPENIEKLREWGLAEKIPDPIDVEIAKRQTQRAQGEPKEPPVPPPEPKEE